VHFLTPSLVCHIRPVVLVKTLLVLETLLISIEFEALVLGAELKCFPGHCEQLVANSKEATESVNGQE